MYIWTNEAFRIQKFLFKLHQQPDRSVVRGKGGYVEDDPFKDLK